MNLTHLSTQTICILHIHNYQNLIIGIGDSAYNRYYAGTYKEVGNSIFHNIHSNFNLLKDTNMQFRVKYYGEWLAFVWHTLPQLLSLGYWVRYDFAVGYNFHFTVGRND